MTLHPQASLLGLPQELRDQILDHLILLQPFSLSARDLQWHDPHKTQTQTARTPSICRVNRQLRSETLIRFYSRNTFRICTDDSIYDEFMNWLHDVGDNVQHIHRLEICGWVKPGLWLQKRWIVALFDLREGSMKVVSGVENAELRCVKGLNALFNELVESRKGRPFGMLEFEILGEEFHELCYTPFH